jgi:hypothetical protein
LGREVGRKMATVSWYLFSLVYLLDIQMENSRSINKWLQIMPNDFWGEKYSSPYQETLV